MRNAYLLVTATFEPFPKVPACGTEWGINCSTMCATGFYPSMGSWLAWSAATPFWYARRRRRRRRRLAAPPPAWCRSAGARSTCSQTKDRLRSCRRRGCRRTRLGHHAVEPRRDVRATEEYACMGQAGAECVHAQSRGQRHAWLCWRFFCCAEWCYSPCFCSEARCGRDGPSAYV